MGWGMNERRRVLPTILDLRVTVYLVCVPRLCTQIDEIEMRP